MPNTLAFVTGGFALGTIKHGNATEQTQVAVEQGVTIGAGLEVQAFRDWTLKGEYLFVKFGESEACGFAFCFRSAERRIICRSISSGSLLTAIFKRTQRVATV